MTIRVATVIASPHWGGLYTLVERTTPFLLKSGVERVVLAPINNEKMRIRLARAGAKVVEINLKRLRFTLNPLTHFQYFVSLLLDSIKLAQICRDSNISVIEASGLLNFQPVIAAKILSTPLVWQLHGTSALRILRLIFGTLAASVSDILMTSGKGMIDKHGGIKRANSKIIPFCASVDLNVFCKNAISRFYSRELMEVSASDIVIGTFGNFGRVKNHSLIVEAATLLVEYRKKIKFRLVGNPIDTNWKYYNRTVVKPIKEKGFAEDGFVKVMTLSCSADKVMNGFDIFLLTSTGEGISLVTAEAVACGLPIISTDVGSLSDIVIDNVNGFLIQNGDAIALAKNIMKIVNENLIESMGENSRKVAKKHISIEKCALAHVHAYRSVLLKK